MEVPAHIAYWKAWGCNPTPVAWGETYLALQQGLVDAQENAYETIYAAKLNELFNIQFEGLDTSQRLFLPEDMLETQGRGQIMVTPLAELVEKNRKEAGQ